MPDKSNGTERMSKKDAGKTFTAQISKSRAYLLGYEAGKSGRGMDGCPYGQSNQMAKKARSRWIEGLDAGVLRKCEIEEEDRKSAIVPIKVNVPFERVPQHASDPGFGPVPPEPEVCPHGVRKEFRHRCEPCNTPFIPPTGVKP